MHLSPASLVLGLGVVLLLVSLGLYLLQRRQRRQVEALLQRLGELDPEGAAERVLERGPAPLPEVGAGPEAPPASTGGATAEPGAASVAPTADVLAGKTSYVRRTVEGGTGEPASLAEQTILCIHNRLAENLSPGQLADQLFVSLRTLERGLAASLGCTPGQLILAMKMREARRLLQSGQCRVNEVATRLGFSSPYHFSRRFKEFYRVAPSKLIEK